jgi:hypothetical protein
MLDIYVAWQLLTGVCLRPTPTRMSILASQKEVCLSSTVDILPLLPSSLQQHHAFGADKQDISNSKRRQVAVKCIEREDIFAIPLSSKAKCLSLLRSLLEDEFSMHIYLGGAVLHGVVGLSLSDAPIPSLVIGHNNPLGERELDLVRACTMEVLKEMLREKKG